MAGRFQVYSAPSSTGEPPGTSSPATRTDVESTRLAPRIAGWLLLAWVAWAVVGAL